MFMAMMCLWCHLSSKIAPLLMPELVHGKEVNLFGSMVQKNYVTSSNEFRTKIYMIADYIEFVGKNERREVAS